MRGGAFRDEQVLPRVTLLAQGRAGWAAICRLVSATHLSGERGRPVADLDLLAPHLVEAGCSCCSGPASELGSAVTRHRDDEARAVLDAWRAALPPENLVVELVSHRRAAGARATWGPGSSPHAARMIGLARAAGVSARC